MSRSTVKEKLRVSLPSWGREAVEAQGGSALQGLPCASALTPGPRALLNHPVPWPDTGLKDWLRDKGKPWGLSPP